MLVNFHPFGRLLKAGTRNEERGTGNRERGSGNDRLAVSAIKIQNGGLKK